MIPLCAEEGIGVIPWSPLARGLLAGSRKSLDDKQTTTRAGSDPFAQVLYDNPHDWDVVEAVKKVAEAKGHTPAEVSLAWLLSKPTVVAPIIGATKMDHLEAALRSLDVKLTPDEVKALEAPYQPHAVRGM